MYRQIFLTKSAEFKELFHKSTLINKYTLELVIIFIFLICLFVFRFLFFIPDMDELWNYQFARRILNQQVPYRDFCMLQVPFSAQFNALMLSLFCDKLIVLRILGGIIASVNGIIIYLTLKYLNITKLKAFIFLEIFVCLVCFYPENNYSWYAVLFLSIALSFELIKINNFNQIAKANIIEFFIGIFLGFTAITKHNIGIMGALVSSLFTFYCYEKYWPSKNKMKYISLFKSLIFKILGLISIIGAEVLYLWREGALVSFYDQAFTGARLFLKYCYLPYSTLLHNEVFAVRIISVIPIIIIALFVKAILYSRSKKEKTIFILLFAYSIINYSMLFPISDIIHLIFSLPLPLISLAALEMGKANYNMKKIEYIIFGFSLFLVIIVNLNIAVNNLKLITPTTQVNHYEYIPLPDGAKSNIKIVDQTIMDSEFNDENKIYFLDYRATFYLIPVDKFNDKYDTMLLGNFGTSGEIDVIEKISEKNSKVFIRGEDMLGNRQESKLLYDYVRNNMKYVINVGGFDVYTN